VSCHRRSLRRQATAALAAVCASFGWLVLVAAPPAYADNCNQLLKDKGKTAVLTDPGVLADCVRTGKGWAVTTGGVVTFGGVVIGTVGLRGRRGGEKPGVGDQPGAGQQPPGGDKPPVPEPPHQPTQEERDKARDCARLQSDFETKKARKDGVVNDLNKLRNLLESMYSSQRTNGASMAELTSLRNEALAYLAGAGVVTGLAAGAAGAGYAAAMAARLTAAAETISVIGEGMEATAGTGGFQMGQVAAQMMKESFSLQALAQRLLAGGAAVGGGAGTLTGKLVQDFMTDSMGNFNHSLEVFDRMVSETEAQFRAKQQELEYSVRDLRELRDRLQQECQITVDIRTDSVAPPPHGTGGGIQG
jgi:hypothetical protein